MSQEEFDQAVAWVADPASQGEKALKGVPTARKLNLYKFFKQAQDGDVTISQPWAIQIEARQKWDAWNSVKGTTPEAARQGYIDELKAQKDEYPRVD